MREVFGSGDDSTFAHGGCVDYNRLLKDSMKSALDSLYTLDPTNYKNFPK